MVRCFCACSCLVAADGVVAVNCGGSGSAVGLLGASTGIVGCFWQIFLLLWFFILQARLSSLKVYSKILSVGVSSNA